MGSGFHRHHTHTRRHPAPGTLERRCVITQFLHDGLSHGLCCRLVGLRKDNRKLIASQPCHHVTLTQSRRQQQSDRHQQLITGIVAKRVVDFLEVVKVEQKHRPLRPIALATLEMGLQHLLKSSTVGQSRQRIVIRHVRQFSLITLALRDIDHVDQYQVLASFDPRKVSGC